MLVFGRDLWNFAEMSVRVTICCISPGRWSETVAVGLNGEDRAPPDSSQASLLSFETNSCGDETRSSQTPAKRQIALNSRSLLDSVVKQARAPESRARRYMINFTTYLAINSAFSGFTITWASREALAASLGFNELCSMSGRFFLSTDRQTKNASSLQAAVMTALVSTHTSSSMTVTAMIEVY